MTIRISRRLCASVGAIIAIVTTTQAFADDTTDLGPVKVTLNVLGSLRQVVDVAQVVQAQMNKAGFEVALYDAVAGAGVSTFG